MNRSQHSTRERETAMRALASHLFVGVFLAEAAGEPSISERLCQLQLEAKQRECSISDTAMAMGGRPWRTAV